MTIAIGFFSGLTTQPTFHGWPNVGLTTAIRRNDVVSPTLCSSIQRWLRRNFRPRRGDVEQPLIFCHFSPFCNQFLSMCKPHFVHRLFLITFNAIKLNLTVNLEKNQDVVVIYPRGLLQNTVNFALFLYQNLFF